MSFQFKLERVMGLKEREKDELTGEYNKSIEAFEKVGQKLYELLKKKEDLAILKGQQIQQGISISQIQQTERFIAALEQSIMHYQQLVAQARAKMSEKEEELIEKNIEVKKFEKMKEKQQIIYKETIEYEEKKLMDEISLQQYMHRGN
ncbi:flagellar export protein FliJ [Bacillus tianshenii]|nr:flagellar export protein FliJ [Bacillus tianshenii]